jgi:intein-encoded DNA endonuclease-like protein
MSQDLRVKWTSEQEQTVINSYNGSGSTLENVLPFTSSAIRNKARRLGVKNKAHFHNIHETQLPEIDKIDLSYIAGFVDGEGSIYLNAKNKSFLGQWRIGICNTDKPVIDWMLMKLACGVVREYLPRKGQHKIAYVLDINRQGDVCAILKVLLPYLRVKKSKAFEAIQDIEAKMMLSY